MQHQEIASVQLQLASSIQKQNGIQCTHNVVLFEKLYFYYILIART